MRFLLFSVPELGHIVPILSIGKELSRRGHKVQLATCAFLAPKMESLCAAARVDFVGLAREVQSPELATGKAANLKRSGLTCNLYVYYSEAMYAAGRQLVEETRPHVIITDFMTIVGCRLGKETGVPVAVNFADPVLFNLAGPSPRSLFPYVMALSGPYLLRTKWASSAALFRISENIRESIYTRLVFINSICALQPKRPLPPNAFLTGPLGTRDAGELQESPFEMLNDWLAWVRAQRLRVVYVSFGTMVQLSVAHIMSLYSGLSDVPGIAVAWSLRLDQQQLLPVEAASLPKRFLVLPWFPQAETVRLPEVKLAITHCGWGGLMEILAAGKPLVAVPFRGDQPSNAVAAYRQGVCEVLEKDRLSAALVRSAVKRVLDEASYRESSERLQRALLSSGGALECALRSEALGLDGLDISRKTPSQAMVALEAASLILLTATAACMTKSLVKLLQHWRDHGWHGTAD